jgi:hypothetical protein
VRPSPTLDVPVLIWRERAATVDPDHLEQLMQVAGPVPLTHAGIVARESRVAIACLMLRTVRGMPMVKAS